MKNLDTLLVARAFASKRGGTARELATALLRFAPTDRDEARWRDELLARTAQLQSDGILDAACKLVDRTALASRIGPHGARSWAQLADKLLPALAIGVAANDAKAHERLVGRDGWAAAIAGRALRLWTDGAPPSLASVCDTYVWQSLGLPGKPKRCPPEVRAHFLQQHLQTEPAGPERQVYMLAAKSVGVVRSDLRSLREGLVRMWLRGEAVSAGRADLIADVLDVSRSATDGVFGDRKVFISAVWDRVRQRAGWRTLGLDEFKSRLVSAHRAGDLVLARADLVAAMDPRLVDASETRTDAATFHFIVREPA